MSKVRVLFLGTSEFAAICLQSIFSDEHFDIVTVVTQPDRPAGRKLQLQMSPVKKVALDFGLPILTPEKINNTDELKKLADLKAEVAVVVAFGQILSEDFLKLFPLGAVNVHGSILPKWRGAAPIQRSIQAGERVTGVTLQKIVRKLDAGDILGIRKLEVDADITALEAHDKLAKLGADLLHVELMDYVRGNLIGEKQDESKVTIAKKIEKHESEIDWNDTSFNIHNKVRAFTMGPGTYTLFRANKLKIHKTKLVEFPSDVEKNNPGQICEIKEDIFSVKTGDGALEIHTVQPENKSRMSAKDFINGFKIEKGEQLG